MMKVSLNTIKQFIDFELPPLAELVTIINAQLGGVEEVIDLNPKYQDVVIVKVISCIKHDNADKLSVCLVDDGGVVKDLERNENGFVQVVCGAPNVHDGMFAAWLPPKSTVPASFDDKEPFVLEAREIRGVISNGMLAAADELAIGTNHDGIIEITESDLPSHEPRVTSHELKPGANFAELFGLDDSIIDIENKMFTHRPDLFGQLGVAREIAGILGHQFKSPKWYTEVTGHESRATSHESDLALTVLNEAFDKVPRFMAVAIKDIEVKPSPRWLQCALIAMGSKPINNIVDVTNYVMLLTAQPTHAYDYDKLRGHKLGARMANTGEQLPLLNGKTYTLETDDIVIVDGEGPVGLGGIMGGGNSEVSADTKNIVLEVANFDMYTVRKSSMRYGLFTDALTRFNKGQSPLQNDRIIALLMQSVFDVAGGAQASELFDIHAELPVSAAVRTSTKYINDRLGLELDAKTIETLLGNVEFSVDTDSEDARFFKAPFWRTDIEQPEDIVEEVGRLYGFDKLPRELPKRSISPTTKNASREAKRKIRSSLANSGLNEVLTYSFVHENTMISAEQSIDQAFRLSNAISPDLQYYRLSVLPSLLDKVHMNIKSGYDEFGLFEIGKGHNKKYHANDDAGLPLELEFVDIIYANKTSRKDAPFFQIRRIVDQLAIDLGFELKFLPIKDNLDFPVTAPFEQSRSAMVESLDGEFIGMIGELKQTVIKNFKLPAYSAAATLDFDGIKKAVQNKSKDYNVLSRFPSISYDLSLKGSSTLAYADVSAAVKEAFSDTVGKNVKFTIMPTSIYQANEASETTTTTFHIVFKNNEKTLTVDEAKLMVKAAVDIVVSKLDLQLV